MSSQRKVLLLDGGTVENRQEYFSHHLAADIEFTKAVKEERTPFSYRCEGNVAWLVSTSTSIGRLWDSGRMEDPCDTLVVGETPASLNQAD